MSSFVDSIVSRFSGTENTISPRLPGKFETSYHDESNLLEEPGHSMVPIEQSTTLTEHDEYAERSVISGSGDLTDRTGNGHETKDLSVLNESRQHRSIDATNVNKHEQRQGIQKENIRDSYVLTSQVHKQNSGDPNKETQHQQTIKKSSDFDTFNALMSFDPVSRLVEKESQRNEIHKPLTSPIVAEPSRKNYTNIPDPNFQTKDNQNESPVIKISIGRIEVRATPVTSASKSKDEAPQKPQMSLEEYLQKRNKGQ